jgi:CDGSH-type Zn-finger protein
MEHKVTVREVSWMIDQAFCSCGWESHPYFDGAEYARQEFAAHEKQSLSTSTSAEEKDLGR